MSRRIKIFDTTLRDGEQSPGCSMNFEEKLAMAKQLEVLGVDIMEAGFAAASKGDFESVKKIAETVKNSTVASLARAVQGDIDKAYEAVRYAESPRIHTFIATSDIHMKYKLRMEPETVIARAVDMVKYAKSFISDIEFSAEDATRSNPLFLARVIDAVIEAGATTINLPDTVGYTTPDEYYDFLIKVREASKHLDKVDLSTHCHDDLGLAVANSLSAVRAGATQIECTINGIGERAGNAALEEIAMAIQTRSDIYNVTTGINTREIMKTSKLLSSITGVYVQPNKAIVGDNAFAHESGIHQHGVLANASTYEIMSPESVGLTANNMVLGKHSGKHGFTDRVKQLGFDLDGEKIEKVFAEFKALADKKKTVYDDDIEALVMKYAYEQDDSFDAYKLNYYVSNTGNNILNTSTVTLDYAGESYTKIGTGDGPIDAAYNAIRSIIDIEHVTEDFSIRALTEGNDALGEANIKIKAFGRIFNGGGVSTDIIGASIDAYLNALNKILAWKKTNDDKVISLYSNDMDDLDKADNQDNNQDEKEK